RRGREGAARRGMKDLTRGADDEDAAVRGDCDAGEQAALAARNGGRAVQDRAVGADGPVAGDRGEEGARAGGHVDGAVAVDAEDRAEAAADDVAGRGRERACRRGDGGERAVAEAGQPAA